MPTPVQILLATYNASPFLDQQLQSIQEQTHQDWQLLIRDDASTDATWAMLEAHARRDPRRITLLRSPTNAGALPNFAALLDRTDADYVMFADADDWWFPDKISQTLAAMQALEARHPRGTPLLVHSDLKVANAYLSVRCDSFWHYQGIHPRNAMRLSRLLIENAVTGCTAMLNRALVERARPIPCADGRVIMHDWWIALVAAAFGQVGTIQQPLMLYRQHPRNHTGAKPWTTAAAMRRLPHFFDNTGLRTALGMTQRQAAAFVERYRDSLTSRQARMIDDYAGLYQHNPLARRRLILTHGFYRTGLIRNLSLLLRG